MIAVGGGKEGGGHRLKTEDIYKRRINITSNVPVSTTAKALLLLQQTHSDGHYRYSNLDGGHQLRYDASHTLAPFFPGIQNKKKITTTFGAYVTPVLWANQRNAVSPIKTHSFHSARPPKRKKSLTANYQSKDLAIIMTKVISPKVHDSIGRFISRRSLTAGDQHHNNDARRGGNGGQVRTSSSLPACLRLRLYISLRRKRSDDDHYHLHIIAKRWASGQG